MIWVLVLLLVVLAGLLLLACQRIETLQEEIRRETDRHKGCHEAVEVVLSAYQGASEGKVLRAAAAAYEAAIHEDPNEKAILARIARVDYVPGGPSMPTLWMLDRAGRIEDAAIKHHDEHNHTLGGKCI